MKCEFIMQCAAWLAQLVEGFTVKQEVAGSVPVVRPTQGLKGWPHKKMVVLSPEVEIK